MNYINIALNNAKILFPIVIPSYNRWERSKNKTLVNIIEKLPIEAQSNTYVFVREEQQELYKESFKTVNVIPLPSGTSGLATTRQYMEDYMLNYLKQPYFIDMDDDIIALKYIEYRDGKPSLSLIGNSNPYKILCLGSEIAKIAFEKDNCVLGNFHRVRFANTEYNAKHCYTTNKGATPRQVSFVNAMKLAELRVRRNNQFDINGDDMGFVAEITRKYGDLFNINCLAYAYVDDAHNSVIRNAENIKKKTNYTYECLKQYPIINYMRIPFRHKDGSYKFGDIDFAKYRKLCNKQSVSLTLEELCKVKNWK